MKIALINTNRMKPPVAPIGLDYLSDGLSASGHEVRLLDLCFSAQPEADIASMIRGYDPDAIGMSLRNTDDCYFTSAEFFLPGVKRMVDEIHGASGAPIVMGGVGFSVMPEAVMRYCGPDFGIAGEGEEAFPLLLDALVKDEGFGNVPGLLWWVGGKLRVNPPSPIPLDRLPERSRSLVDNRRYFAEGGQAGFETKRGCAMGCIYCADPVAKGRQVRLQDPARVARELTALYGLGIDHFHTCDAEFNIPAEHAKAVSRAIIDMGLGEKIRWYAYCSITPFDAELAAVMRKAGCVGIDFGADSGSDPILERLGRHFRAGDLARTASICRAEGIRFMYDLLVGGPGETRESARETIELTKRIQPDCVGLSLGVRIYGGTALAREVTAQGEMGSNPALHGETMNNPDFLRPVYFVSPDIGADITSLARELVAGDRRFFLPSGKEENGNYNYNDNSVLVRAIENGARGAYWDILRTTSPNRK